MNIFKQLIRSIYSPKDIATFRFQGIGKSILYVFFLTLLSVIPTIYFLSSAISDGIRSADEMLTKEFPPFTIENGRLHSDMKEPITINKNGFVFIFDSTGELSKKDAEKHNNAIALLERDIVFIAGGQSQSYSYSMVEELTLSKKDLVKVVDSVESTLPIIIPVLSLIVLIFSSGINFIEISILALVGFMMVNASGRNLKYGQVWRMSAYSITLPTLFFTIMTALNTAVPGGFFIYWIVSYIMLYLAFKELPKPQPK